MKYTTRASDDWYPDDHLTCTVLEDERTPIDTGLLDSHGVPIYRVQERNPIGSKLS